MNALPRIKVREIPFQEKLARRTLAQLEGQKAAYELRLGDHYKPVDIARKIGYTHDDDTTWFVEGFMSVASKFVVHLDEANRIIGIRLKRQVRV